AGGLPFQRQQRAHRQFGAALAQYVVAAGRRLGGDQPVEGPLHLRQLLVGDGEVQVRRDAVGEEEVQVVGVRVGRVGPYQVWHRLDAGVGLVVGGGDDVAVEVVAEDAADAVGGAVRAGGERQDHLVDGGGRTFGGVLDRDRRGAVGGDL